MIKSFFIAGTNRHFLEDHSTSPPVTTVVNYGMSVSIKRRKSPRFLPTKNSYFWLGQLVSERPLGPESNKDLRRAVAPRQLHKRGSQANWARRSDSNPSFVNVHITSWQMWQVCHNVQPAARGRRLEPKYINSSPCDELYGARPCEKYAHCPAGNPRDKRAYQAICGPEGTRR